MAETETGAVKPYDAMVTVRAYKHITGLTLKQIVDLLDGGADEAFYADSERLFKRWLDRGDGIAVYENKAMDSTNMGHKKFVSYGSDEALLPTPDSGVPPIRLPDSSIEINWPYQLVSIFARCAYPPSAPYSSSNR